MSFPHLQLGVNMGRVRTHRLKSAHPVSLPNSSQFLHSTGWFSCVWSWDEGCIHFTRLLLSELFGCISLVRQYRLEFGSIPRQSP